MSLAPGVTLGTVQTLGIKGGWVDDPLGKRAIPLQFDFTAAGFTGLVDLQAQQSQSQAISFISTIWIDTTGTTGTTTITFAGGFQLVIPSNRQGWLSVICQNPIQFTVKSSNGNGGCNMELLNYDVPPFLYTP